MEISLHGHIPRELGALHPFFLESLGLIPPMQVGPRRNEAEHKDGGKLNIEFWYAGTGAQMMG